MNHDTVSARLMRIHDELRATTAELEALPCRAMGSEGECVLADALMNVALAWRDMDAAADHHFDTCEYFGVTP